MQTLQRISLEEMVQNVCSTLSSADYLENNFRVVLARLLRQNGYHVYEEVVIPYTLPQDKIPFGHGFADIVVMVADGAILLELKASKKDCKRQLGKYLRHWSYSNIVYGATVNFVQDTACVDYI